MNEIAPLQYLTEDVLYDVLKHQVVDEENDNTKKFEVLTWEISEDFSPEEFATEIFSRLNKFDIAIAPECFGLVYCDYGKYFIAVTFNSSHLVLARIAQAKGFDVNSQVAKLQGHISGSLSQSPKLEVRLDIYPMTKFMHQNLFSNLKKIIVANKIFTVDFKINQI